MSVHRRQLFSFLAISPIGLFIPDKEPKPDVRLAARPCRKCGSDLLIKREEAWSCIWCKKVPDDDAA